MSQTIQEITGRYSDAHKGAFILWRENNCRFDGLEDATLTALAAEDSGFAREIAEWRRDGSRTPASKLQATDKPTGDFLKRGWFMHFIRQLVSDLGEATGDEFRTTRNRIAALEQKIGELDDKIATLEAQPKGLDYHGRWERAVEYERHAGVTFDGSLWVAVTDRVRGVPPGSDPASWQLAVKRGADGKDASR
jgi:hypothetical protein